MKIIDLSGPEGNVFVLMGIAANLIKQKGHSQIFIGEVMDDMKSKNYHHALDVFESHLKDIVTFINDPRI